jgi:uncharacterized UBP type Zn finger protein
MECVGTLQSPGKELHHFHRIKSYNKSRDPIRELQMTGITLYDGQEIRKDIYDFMSPDLVYYELKKCRSKKHVSFNQ